MYFHPLNFLRFVLALGVILFHYGIKFYPFNEGALNTLIVNSSFRVSFFFFISGFVMSMVYGRKQEQTSPQEFYKKRFTRIFPVYWLAFIITLLVVIFIKDAAPKGLNILLHGFGLQSLNPGHVLDLNYPTWSISVELIFYLAFPYLLRWMHRFSVRKLATITFVLWLLQSLQHILCVEYLYNGSKISEEFISTFPLWHLLTFFAGMAAARLIALNAVRESAYKYSGLMMLIALTVLAYIIYLPNPFLKYAHNGLLSPVFMLFIVGLYYNSSLVAKGLSRPGISKLGDFSYGLFIFQYPVWVICSCMADEKFALSTWFFLIYLLVLFTVSFLVNRYFEKPLLKKLRGN